MVLPFTKMQGCGNDYIYINCFENTINEPESLSVRLSDRHYGVGGDGIVLISRSAVADASMRMFNLDGSEGGMCGNAIRCVGKYLYDNQMICKPEMTIETRSGIKQLQLLIKDGLVSSVRVDMGKARLDPAQIPVRLAGDRIVAKAVQIGGREYAITCVSMGNPHCVVFCDRLDELSLAEIGPLFEYDALFPDRVNTEFVEILSKDHLKMRVWERGSGETLACGTGACASVVAAVLNGYCDKDREVTVRLLGGALTVQYTEDAVFMTGECKKVFDGVVEL